MNVAFTQSAEGLPRRAFTVADIRRMIDAGVIGEDERIELVEGEIVVMSAKGYAHELIKNALIVAIVRALPERNENRRRNVHSVRRRHHPGTGLGGVRAKRIDQVRCEFLPTLNLAGCLLAIEVAASSLGYDKA